MFEDAPKKPEASQIESSISRRMGQFVGYVRIISTLLSLQSFDNDVVITTTCYLRRCSAQARVIKRSMRLQLLILPQPRLVCFGRVREWQEVGVSLSSLYEVWLTEPERRNR